MLELSTLESKRFNLIILRGSTPKLDAFGLLQAIVAQRADVAILRLPSTEQHILHQLQLLPFPTIVADTLVYYQCDLTTASIKPLRNQDLEVRMASLADTAALEQLIDLVFENYSTHYYSNPLFERQKILDGYKEWTLQYLQPTEGRLCFLFFRGGQLIAFATCSRNGQESEGILYGVHPSAQGGGVYGDLIRYTMQFMKNEGATLMKVSTQVQNYAVQKVWAREGFYLSSSYCTIHLNALLNQRSQSLVTGTQAS